MPLKRGERSQGTVGHLGVGVERRGSHALGEYEKAGGSLWIRVASQRGWGHPFLSCPTVCILRKGSVMVESFVRECFCSVAAGWGDGNASLFSVVGQGWGGGGNRNHCCLGKVRATYLGAVRLPSNRNSNNTANPQRTDV